MFKFCGYKLINTLVLSTFLLLYIVTFIESPQGQLVPFTGLIRPILFTCLLLIPIIFVRKIYLDKYSIICIFLLSVLFSYGLISSLWSSFPQLVMQRSFLVFFPIFGFIAILYSDSNPKDTFHVTSTILIVAGTFLSLYGVLLIFFGTIENGNNVLKIGSYVISQEVTSSSFRISSLLGNPNRLAAFFIITIPLTLSQIFYRKGQNVSLLLIILLSLLLQVVALFLTQSRAGFISAATSVVILILLYTHPHKFNIKRISIAIISLVMFIPITTYSLYGRFDSLDFNNRLELWSLLLISISENPVLGIGFAVSNESILYPAGQITHPHSTYLALLSEIGLLGILPFITFLFVVLYVGVKRSINNTDENKICIIASVAVIIGFLVQSLIETSIFRPTFRHLFWMFYVVLIFHPLLNSSKVNNL